MAEICRHDSGLLKEIITGINLGFRECEFQFRNRRWNCTALRKSMRKILMKDTRETGFVNAITSAGVTYAVTRACTMGNLVECSCDKSHSRRNGGQPQIVNAATAVAALERQQAAAYERKVSNNNNNNNHSSSNSNSNSHISTTYSNNNNNNSNNISNKALKLRRPQHGGGGGGRRRGNDAQRRRKLLRNIKFPDGEWEWGGCSDNVNFGFRNPRIFLDSKYRRRSDLRTLVKLHNNNAGRLSIRDSMRPECKCHGLSGSCTVKTCWLKMPPFREIASQLRNKFDRAFKVVLRNDGNSFMPDGAATKLPTKYDLVYSDDSPDFCVPNMKLGSLGTQDRECNATSTGMDGCDSLCCSRGHKHRMVSEWANCKCVFKWCCEVTCEKCLERREVNTCL